MIPPVLEIYVVWHPSEVKAAEVAGELVEHFNGTIFTGLIRGAVEVFMRSEGWRNDKDAPRPIPRPDTPLPNDIRHAEFTVVVPLMGTEMAKAVETGPSSWRSYLENVCGMREENPKSVAVFPYLLDSQATDKTVLGKLLGKYQRIANSTPDGETEASLRCRDLSQGISQFLSGDENRRLNVFISYTNQEMPEARNTAANLVEMVRCAIENTHLSRFFSPSDLQPGREWEKELREKAASSALLALRTDLYPSREWCQREISIAKREGMPVIIMDALDAGEERGSFLMDHVPRVPVGKTPEGGWQKRDIYRALNLLVDECLKRELWIHQQALSGKDPRLEIAWWAPHAPEPLTLVEWLGKSGKEAAASDGRVVRILHPDPPLGPEEKLVLEQVLSLGRPGGELDIMTPRLLAARGGYGMESDPERSHILPPDALEGTRLGISVSGSPDLGRLGLLESHFRLALGEIARCVLLCGGKLGYGGHLDPEGYTAFLVKELQRYGRRDRPLRVFLAWREHRKLSVADIGKQKELLGLCGEIVCLDVDGAEIDPFEDRSEQAVEETDEAVRGSGLTAMRGHMAENTDGRIFLGGRRTGFQGSLPGLVEEAIMALERGQPIYLAGGFGGVTIDMVRALGVDDGAILPTGADEPAKDKRLVRGLEKLADTQNRTGRKGLDNGLTESENRKLAATHRPSEIAALVSLGLGRRFAETETG